MLSPDGAHFAYRRADQKLGLTAVAEGKARTVEHPEEGFVPQNIWFAPDGKSLFFSNYGGGIARCDPATGKLVGYAYRARKWRRLLVL